MNFVPIYNFTVLESIYGRFILNRHCAMQADQMIKTGQPHIQGELNNLLSVVNTLPEKCVIVDAGANAGLVALPMALLVRQRGGVVHAFEVQRLMFYALCGTVALNDLENLFVLHQGLGAKRESVTVARPNYSVAQDFGMFSLAERDKDSPQPLDQNIQEVIEIVPLDDLRLPRVDFFKIDVEGMELQVLAGAKQTIVQHHPWCWIEYWKVNMDDIKAQFAGLPYRFYVMDDLNLLCAPIERLEAAKMEIKTKEV